MKTSKVVFLFILVLAVTIPLGLATAAPPDGKGPPVAESEGNNLSYPVIWAEGVTKTLRGTLGEDPILQGEWWYWWGTSGIDPNIVPLSCPPDPDNEAYCDDGTPLQATGDLPGEGYVKAYLQKDAFNTWQAGSADWSASPVNVHWIDWGDNLESVDWYTRSQVRTEVVLFQDLTEPMLEYEMRHTSGWGIDEVHGLAATPGSPDVPILGPGTRATVYSHCARLTIQKLLVTRDNPALADLIWVPGEGWTEPEGYETDLINPHIFNGSVHEGGDGPGYYSAEINVKGRIIYGYTWNVRNLHDDYGSTPAGDYRITFSLDQVCGTSTLNTFFEYGVTQIMVPVEEEEMTTQAISEEPGGGATGVLVPAQFDEVTGELLGGNLTYIDVRILERGGGGGGHLSAKRIHLLH